MIITVSQLIQLIGIMCQYFRQFLLFSASVLAMFSCLVIIKKIVRW